MFINIMVSHFPALGSWQASLTSDYSHVCTESDKISQDMEDTTVFNKKKTQEKEKWTQAWVGE